MAGLDRRQGFFWGALILLTSFAAAAGVPVETGDNFERILSGLHPDYPNFVGGIRQGETRFHPPTLYMGLVRPGGKDPTRLDDAPLLGRGVKNDIIVYADSREVGRSPGWGMLLIDHEYFHARHLARGDRTPVPSFGDAEADRHYYEAVAWGYNLAQADEGDYPTLTHADYLEAFRNYTMHFEAFRDFILRHDHGAWAHYKRFLPEPASHERTLLARN
ncbi:MAG: hypothetical protein DMH00_05760 [Acidobacteria bacterium]|nr:MAG: hypothetical protein DMH00_05760 [Acidobacteriota bacterium]